MKQTAVEWLVSNMPNIGEYIYIPLGVKLEFQAKIDQAKEMERQQIMTAFSQGDIFGADYYDGINITEENYYNQTFKSE